ncbi:MAG TPA: hypothetical protein VG055_32840 [Planctomycetaceae bacterium]|jgi:hypothetical protein|nr:hypothetical protein [Planctomycetaceae bacterium]
MATVSFDSDIKPLFAQFVGEMRWRLDLTRYEDVRANSQMIYAFIRSSDPDGRMPPPPFDPLTLDQIARFKTWMDEGFPP